jgi:hypothetical protein
MLIDMGFHVYMVNVPRPDKSVLEVEYRRLISEIYSAYPELDVIWLAVPPGCQALLVDCALDHGFNVIVEKPWVVESDIAGGLVRKAAALGLMVAINYQYCYLKKIVELSGIVRADIDGHWIFSGEFTVEGRNRLGLDAEVNLAEHLRAIHYVHFRGADYLNVRSGYEGAGRRIIELESEFSKYFVDFTNNREPIIQYFVEDFILSIRSDKVCSVSLGSMLGMY